LLRRLQPCQPTLKIQKSITGIQKNSLKRSKSLSSASPSKLLKHNKQKSDPRNPIHRTTKSLDNDIDLNNITATIEEVHQQLTPLITPDLQKFQQYHTKNTKKSSKQPENLKFRELDDSNTLQPIKLAEFKKPEVPPNSQDFHNEFYQNFMPPAVKIEKPATKTEGFFPVEHTKFYEEALQQENNFEPVLNSFVKQEQHNEIDKTEVGANLAGTNMNGVSLANYDLEKIQPDDLAVLEDGFGRNTSSDILTDSSNVFPSFSDDVGDMVDFNNLDFCSSLNLNHSNDEN